MYLRANEQAAQVLPEELAQRFALCPTPLAALEDAAALVVATGWPEYHSLTTDTVVSAMRMPVVVDPNRFLEKTLGSDSRIRYATVGKALL